jgi:MFS family permease
MPAWRLTLLLCLGETLNMAGYSAVAALLPELRLAWSLGNAEIGIVEGAFSVGYVVAVPVLVTWTDRRDPRAIYLAATALGIAASLGLAFLARDLWSAALFRCLAGIALAGTFMPRLKILTDAVAGPKQSRWLAFYTATFSLGAGLSTAASGAIGHAADTSAAFVFAATGGGAAWLLVSLTIPPRPQPPRPHIAPGGRCGRRRETERHSHTRSPMRRTCGSCTAFAPGWSPTCCSLRPAAWRRRAIPLTRFGGRCCCCSACHPASSATRSR